MTRSSSAIQPGRLASKWMMAHLLGVPYDANSSFQRGAALAPARIRETLHSGSSNWFTELGVDLQAGGWVDAGDVVLPPQPGDLPALTEAAGHILEQGGRVLALGGDHSITYPLVRAQARFHGPLTILHIDAHPDLYDSLDGNPFSHACPFARIMEAGLAARLVQVGIRTLNDHQRAQAGRFEVEMIEMGEWSRGRRPVVEGPFYLSLDLDGLDPAYAPGVSHHEAGGLTTREVIDLLHDLPGPILGADLVEYNPLRDPTGITAALAAKLVKEIIGRMSGR
ncbi:MAG: agmatinase [Chloroflexota bacterium]|jgi:arginase